MKNFPSYHIKTVCFVAALLLLCACSDDLVSGEYKSVEGILQVSMIPSRGPEDMRQFTSQVEMITDDAIFLLLLNDKTEFIDAELPHGELKLGQLYKAETVKSDIPSGINFQIDVNIDAVLLVKRLERIGPPGPDAPTREKVRMAKAYKLSPQVMELAKAIDESYKSLVSDDLEYKEANIDFIPDHQPVECGQKNRYRGTFYCSDNQTVFLDRHWIVALEVGRGNGIPYDMEYMLAHTYAHHVQNLSGISRPESPEAGITKELVSRVIAYELQADCIAGVALANMDFPGIIEPGDVTEAVATASMVGDDALQGNSSSHVIHDTLTHATRDRRSKATLNGFKGATISACM